MTKFNFLFFVLAAMVLVACDDDDKPVEPTYDIPATYNFENVSYSGQTQRLGMLSEIKSYMGEAKTQGTALDADRLAAMYANSDVTIWDGTYEDSKQLRSKTFEAAQPVFDALFAAIATSSESTVAGSNGQAGVIESADGAKKYLFNANGVEEAQLIEKGLMGACLYYQSTGVYMEPGKIDVDNEEVTPGKGTKMEHHWDEAFGYFAVPTDFPTNTDGIAFWGKYCNSRDEILGTNAEVMNGFLKGRAAISNKDMDTRDEAIAEVRTGWEKVVAGTGIHYINSGISNFDDFCLRGHGLSEAIAFVYSLQFNPSKTVTNAQVSEILTLIAGSDDFATMNLYNAEVSKLEEAKNKLAEYAGLTAHKDEL